MTPASNSLAPDSSSSESPTAATKPATFADLGLSKALLASLKAAGYEKPTAIQQQAIPHVLEGKDLLGSAQTGTGKTAAFALPVLQKIMGERSAGGGKKGKPKIQTLVLAPTRELAAQIGASFEKYAGPGGPRQHVVYGGVSKRPQYDALQRGIEVLVATPGRLIDLMEDGVVHLDHVHTLILDEADRMLDMGFIHDVRHVAKILPENRQTLMFSATMPPEIQRLADRILKDPVRIAVDKVSSVVEPIAQSVYFVEQTYKVALLLQLLADESMKRVLVFTGMKFGADRVAGKLEFAGVGSAAIHGNKSQAARTRALDLLKEGKIRAIVATDVAARGIDIKGLTHVVNFDVPNEPESYVHRVGRTGRAEATGTAITFCSFAERPDLRDIERLTKHRLERLETPDGLEPASAFPISRKSFEDSEQPRRRGGPGRGGRGGRGGPGGGPRGGGPRSGGPRGGGPRGGGPRGGGAGGRGAANRGHRG